MLKMAQKAYNYSKYLKLFQKYSKMFDPLRITLKTQNYSN